MMIINPAIQQEIISLALKTALHKENAIASKYAELAKLITDPPLQKHLQALEQTARNHLQLLNQQMQQQNIT
jgi:rubrerythrin